MLMTRKRPPKPTDAELALLRVLWGNGPATVRQIRDAVEVKQRTGYTTVLKTLQIMTTKGLVVRDESQHAHIYQAALAQEQTQRQLVSELLERAFSGSASHLVVQALTEKPASRKELAEIRHLLDKLEES
jgi:BlaI family penicillinase repressor